MARKCLFCSGTGVGLVNREPVQCARCIKLIREAKAKERIVLTPSPYRDASRFMDYENDLQHKNDYNEFQWEDKMNNKR